MAGIEFNDDVEFVGRGKPVHERNPYFGKVKELALSGKASSVTLPLEGKADKSGEDVAVSRARRSLDEAGRALADDTDVEKSMTVKKSVTLDAKAKTFTVVFKCVEREIRTRKAAA